MVQFPPISRGVVFARTKGGGVVYDLIGEDLHFLNSSAAAVCAACAEEAPREAALATWAAHAGLPVDRIAADVDAALGDFSARGWIGGTAVPSTFPPDAPVSPLNPGEAHATQAAGLHNIRFRSDDPTLIEAVVDVLGLPPDTGPPTADFHIEATPGGGATLRTDSEWPFPNRQELKDRIIAIVNDFVARTTTGVVLHAAVAESPSGQLVVFASPAGSGKSTLVASLAQRGWVYLTDEAATVRNADLAVLPYPKPLELDSTSRTVLGLAPVAESVTRADDLGPSILIGTRPGPPPSAIVLCTYTGENGENAVESLETDDALVALVRNTLNLRYVGSRGLETLVALAETVPVVRISYRSSDEAFEQLEAFGLR